MKESYCFTPKFLVSKVRRNLEFGLKRWHGEDPKGALFSNLDCVMSAFAMFLFKYPSMLQFENDHKEEGPIKRSLKHIFQLTHVPKDTTMRERIDRIPSCVFRNAFKDIFALLQRNRILDNFRFIDDHYLISIDGTGVFSSKEIHCENCCQKTLSNGSKTYYHQVMAASLVHPNQKIVLPFPPEPIIKSDGSEKNDCERNASKRWLNDFRREHPHLKTIIIGDGLSSNGPFIRTLQEKNCRFILVAKDADHKYMLDFVKKTDDQDAPKWEEIDRGIKHEYHYMNDVPLNDANHDLRVNVIIYKETLKNDKVRKWMFVTDLEVNPNTIKEIIQSFYQKQ